MDNFVSLTGYSSHRDTRPLASAAPSRLSSSLTSSIEDSMHDSSLSRLASSAFSISFLVKYAPDAVASSSTATATTEKDTWALSSDASRLSGPAPMLPVNSAPDTAILGVPSAPA